MDVPLDKLLFVKPRMLVKLLPVHMLNAHLREKKKKQNSLIFRISCTINFQISKMAKVDTWKII